MAFKCKIGFHSWDGCKCSQCEKTRDEQHDWSKDCEQCSKCGKTRKYENIGIICSCAKCSVPEKRIADFFSDCGKGNIKRVEIFLNTTEGKIFNIDARSSYNTSSLGFATAEGHWEIVNLLIEKGADINSQNDLGNSALHCASNKGQIEIVKLLLTNGAKINLQNLEGYTALHEASSGGHLEILKLLLENGAMKDIKTKKGETALSSLFRSINPNMDIFEILFDKDKRSINELKNWSNATIYNASRFGHVETLKKLLKYGLGDITGQDSEGWSPLHWASATNNLPIVQLLLDNGSTIDIKDKDGATSLYIASGRGHKNIVKLLLDKGAKINMQNNYGVFPLYQASREGHLEVVKLLLERGANINLQDEDGWTALHAASKRNRPDVVKLLLEEGASTYLKTNEGKPAHYYAANDSISRLFR